MIELEQVDGDDARFARLMQLYLYDWSRMLPIRLDAEARFLYGDLPLLADREAHPAFLVVDRVARTPVGFAVLEKAADGEWHVGEFFIAAGQRRRGLGASAVRAVFAGRRGPWSLTVRPENPDALHFWRAVLPGARETIEVGSDGVHRTRMSFTV